jgi:hypothetical protein
VFAKEELGGLSGLDTAAQPVGHLAGERVPGADDDDVEGLPVVDL